MKRDSKYKWYLLDIALFAIINILLWQIISDDLDFLEAVSFYEIFVFGLATYRLADVISTEKVTEVIRTPFMEYKIEDGKQKLS